MGFESYRQGAFTKRLADLPDQPNMQAAELKTYFDSSPEELRQALNRLCDALGEFSAAAKLGYTASAGVPAQTVQDAIENVQKQVRDASVGKLPSGCVDGDKLAQDVRNRLIRNLSKGYRQRVGIAQALLGRPEIIILDEPTVGLDPAQIIEIRELIRELGKEHTLVLSSHILSEVQAVCDAIMIISKGRLVASDTSENLTALFAGTVTLNLDVRATDDAARKVLDTVPGIEDMALSAGDPGVTHVQLKPEEGQDIRETLFFAFAKAGLPILSMMQNHASLEDVFLELTQDDGTADSGNSSQTKEVDAQ